MSFKPVTGADLENFDEETRALYAKRESDPRLSVVLATVARKQRNHLPIIVDSENNEYMKELEKHNRRTPWLIMGSFVVFSSCC